MLNPLTASAAPMATHVSTEYFRAVSHIDLLYLSPRQLPGGNEKWDFFAQSTHQIVSKELQFQCSFPRLFQQSVFCFGLFMKVMFSCTSSLLLKLVCP